MSEAPHVVWRHCEGFGLEDREDVLARVRRRINAARSRSGITWEELFKRLDADKSGTLDENELLKHIRVQIALPVQTVSDNEVQTLFEEMDVDGSGTVDLAELFGYLQQGKKTSEQELARVERRVQRVKKNLQMSFTKINAWDGEVGKLFRKLDLDGDAQLSRWELADFVRQDLKLSRWDVTNQDLEDFWRAMRSAEAGNAMEDGVNLKMFKTYVQAKSMDSKGKVGAHNLYTKPDVPKATRRQTYKQTLIEHSKPNTAASLPPRSSSLPELSSSSSPNSRQQMTSSRSGTPMFSRVRSPSSSFSNTGRSRAPTFRGAADNPFF